MRTFKVGFLLSLEDGGRAFATSGHFVHEENATDALEKLTADIRELMTSKMGNTGYTGQDLLLMCGVESLEAQLRQEETIDGQIVRA